MMNIQNEVQKIHNQYGMSEKANYKIQLLCEQYAKEYHDSEDKSKLLLADVSNRRELLIAFQSWQFDKGYIYQKNLQNGMIEEFLKSNL